MPVILLLAVYFPAYAQQDSVKQGVMKVRKAPVSSSYYVQMSYSYSPAKRRFFHKREQTEFIQPNQYEMHPPDPVSFPAQPDDSARMLQDSSFLMEFYEKQDRPAGQFAWINWLDQYEHYFAWNDTAGVDSCVFVYRVNTRGRIELMPGVVQNDSSAQAMSEGLIPYMRKLWLWFPATGIDDAGKQHKFNCVVTVKIFAVRDDQPEKLPENKIN